MFSTDQRWQLADVPWSVWTVHITYQNLYRPEIELLDVLEFTAS